MGVIFISHSSRDKLKVKKLAVRLHQRGYKFFLSFDPSAGIPAARRWESEIYRQLQLSSAVIVVYSKAWLASKWCFAEFTQARALRKAIFRLQISSCKIDGPLAERQAIDFTTNQKEAYERLWDGLRRAGVDPQKEFGWSPDRSPYPGMQPFSQDDAAVYFGREKEVQEGIDRLRWMRDHARTQDALRLMVVLGPSGSGKSSLVRAGIVPRLARDPANWLILPPVRPGTAPLAELLGVLEEVVGRLPAKQRRGMDATHLRQRLCNPGPGLANVARDLAARSGNRQASVLLIIDQFEDLLGADAGDDSREFCRILRSGLVEPGSPLLLVATLRSDFLSTFQQGGLRASKFASQILGPMEAAQMAEAIARPAERAGIVIAADLVRQILAEVGTDDALPLLGFALRAAYERRSDPFRLGIDDYERVGGLHGAVKKKLNDILNIKPLLHEDERRLLSWFLQMVRFSEEGQVARRPVRWSNAPAKIQPALERFIDARLLVSREVNGERMVDAVHESLFRVWEKLANWIKDNRSFLDWHRRLQGAIDAGALLPETALPEAERWMEERSESLDDSQRGFILDGRARRDRRLAEEAQARQREMEQERALRQAEETARREAEVRASEQAEAAQRQRELANEAKRRLAETYWSGAAKAREHNNLTEAAHLLARAAAVEPDVHKRRNIVLGIQHHNRGRLMEVLTDGFEPAANLGRASLPLAPDAMLSPSETLILTRLPGDSTLKGNGVVRLWNAFDSAPAGPPMAHELFVTGAAFNRSENRILTWGTGIPQLGFELGEARLWNAQDGSPVGEPMRQPGQMRGAMFSEDERTIITWGDEGTVRVWDAATGAPSADPIAHENKVVYATYATANQILTVDAAGTSRLWQAAQEGVTGCESKPPAALLDDFELTAWSRNEATFRDPMRNTKFTFTSFVNIRDLIDLPVDKFVCCNRDATRVLTWNSDGSARLLNRADGSQLGKEMEHAWLEKPSFSPSGDRLVLFDGPNSVRVWDSRNGQPISSSLRHDGPVTGVVFDADERHLLSWSKDGSARLWRCADSELVAPALDHPGPVFTAAFSRDETRILTCSADGEARLWNIAVAGSAARALEHDGAVVGAIQNKAESRILSWSASPGDTFSAWLWDSVAGCPAAAPMQHGVRVQSYVSDGTPLGGAFFNADETRIVTWGGDGAVRVWGTDGRALLEPMMHKHRVWGATFNRDESRLLTWSRDGTARLWNAIDGRALSKPMMHDKDVSGAVFCRDENSVLTWSKDGTARLWTARDGAPLAPPMRHEGPVMGACFVRDGSRVLTWSKDGTARLWSAFDGRPLGQPMKHAQGVSGAVFSRDESRILTWTWFFSAWGRTGGDARVWSASDGQPLTSMMTHRAGVSGACFCCNETRVLTWSEDSMAQIWNAADGSPAGRPMIHGGKVHGAVLNRDHSWVLTWSEDGTARLWNIVDGSPFARPMHHEGEVVGATFSADESRILTWSKDRRVRLWNATDGRLILSPLGLPFEVGGAMFCRRECAILAWGGPYSGPFAELWSIEADYELSSERLTLEVELHSGTTMDEHGNVRFLNREEWLERKQRSTVDGVRDERSRSV
jgi:WD40 repeat protein